MSSESGGDTTLPPRGTDMTSDVPARQCQPCNACCEGWLSADLFGHRIRAGHPCPHSTAQGCSIYAQRPREPCQTFICSWLVERSPLPEWMRPDACGAIVLLSMRWQDEFVISAVPVGRSIPERTLDWLKAYAQQHRRPMIFYERMEAGGVFTGLKRFGWGPAAFREKVARAAVRGELDEVPLASVPAAP